MRNPKVIVVLALAVGMVIGGAGFAQDEIQIPEGMELIKVGGTNVLLPKGTRVTRKDAALVLEPLDEYASRLLLMLEEQIAALKTQMAGLQEQLNALQSRLATSEERQQ